MSEWGEFILYTTEDGRERVECLLSEDTLWLSLKKMTELFGRDKSVISKHLKGVFEDGELERDSVVAKNARTAADGKTYQVDYYSLEAVISVGYRVRSPRGVQFRRWVTDTLKEYLGEGFVIDDERLKSPDAGIYFDRLLDRIRDIRSSEKVFWRKICDIYGTSINYDGRSVTSQAFFAQVQNKMHWATHGHTAAEVIHERAYADQSNFQNLRTRHRVKDALGDTFSLLPRPMDCSFEHSIFLIL